MFHHEAEDHLVAPFKLQLVVNDLLTSDLDSISGHEEVGWLHAVLDILVMSQVLEEKLLVVVLLLLVHVEVGAVEVEQTV